MLSCLVQGFLSCGPGSKFSCWVNSCKRSNTSCPLDLKEVFISFGLQLVCMTLLSVLTCNLLFNVLVHHYFVPVGLYLSLDFSGASEYNTACGRFAIGRVTTSFPPLFLSPGFPIHSPFFPVCSANSLKPVALLLQ